MAITRGTFRCVLLTPNRRLLDCRAGSLVVPSHDGQLGILRNHIPMLCKLGLGIMLVRDVTVGKGRPVPDMSFLIDGGFVRVSENNVTVLAYDATSFEGVDMDEVEAMISEAKRLLAGDAYTKQRRAHDVEKAAVLMRLAEGAGLAGKR